MKKMTGGEAVVQSLITNGVDTIFALPGVQNDHLFNALHGKQDKIRVVHSRHEQGAAYMATGYAQATGKPGVYSVVPGPGFLNSTGALSTAYAVNAPVFCLTGQIPSNSIGKGYGLLHELPDQLGIIERLTKWAAHVSKPEDAPGLIDEAFRQLQEGRPRPVGMEIPMDVLAKSAEITLIPSPPDINQPEINLDAIQEAAKLLGNAKNPLIVVGGGAQHASEEVVELAEMLQAPVVPGRSGRGIVSNHHPLGFMTPHGQAYWDKADVVIGIGSRMYQPLHRWGTDDNLKVIRIDLDESEHDRVFPAAVKLTSDSKTTLQALIELLPAHNRKRADITDEVLAHRADMDNNVFAKLEPQWSFVKALRAALPDDGLFVDEVSQIGFTSRFMLPAYHPRSYISTGYQGTLGFGFATALGVKVAYPDKPVLSIAGDGGFMFNVQELATAAKHGINLVVCVFADGAFGNVKRMQKMDYGGKMIASDLHNPDFVKLAESFGILGLRANNADELQKRIEEGFAANAPTLIEIPVGEMPSPWPISFAPARRGVKSAEPRLTKS